LPVASWAAKKWLEDFSYRTHIDWSIYLFAGTVTILFTIATLSLRAIKAARDNPVKSLRTE
jgi:putative ABC transport system permease protein